jgi:hypothetical protein
MWNEFLLLDERTFFPKKTPHVRRGKEVMGCPKG